MNKQELAEYEKISKEIYHKNWVMRYNTGIIFMRNSIIILIVILFILCYFIGYLFIPIILSIFTYYQRERFDKKIYNPPNK